jgi:hypothetical protein
MTVSDYNDMIELAQEPRVGSIQHGEDSIQIIPRERKALLSKGIKRKVSLPDIVLDNKIVILPCIAQAAMGDGNPIHRARFHLANYLAARLRFFFRPSEVVNEDKEKHLEQIIDICEKQDWADYDRSITTTQVRSIVFGDYSPSSCKTLIMEGFCTGICKYYDGTAEDIR